MGIERADRVAYSVNEAAAATGLSTAAIYRALHTTMLGSFPPPLYGRRAGRKYLIPAAELERWVDELPEIVGDVTPNP